MKRFPPIFAFRPSLGWAALTLAALPASGWAKEISFNRDIRPILSDKCFHCHGFDKNTREADLRLDNFEDAIADHDGYQAIVPGDPKKSEAMIRILSTDKDEMMPPPKTGKKLTQAERQLVEQWIAAGAKYEAHWAYVAPKRGELPEVKKPDWVRNPIDRFIAAQLDATGLPPADEADRPTLIRRLALDLTGLPPTPEEVDLFVKDTSPDAYEKAVDRYLSSPHYGEHRGRYWLDAARYGDTHGLHIDNYREMWPYRDWVIGAFNRNLRFDQFTVEQLAGDLLPNRTLDQQIASGFHRCNITTNEGGVIDEEVEAMYAKDRVETTSTVWLGATAGCAACHDHKFDPLPQKEFYAFSAFFRNTQQKPRDGNIYDTPPVIVVPAENERERWVAALKRISDTKGQLGQRLKDNAAVFAEWQKNGEDRKLTAPLDEATQTVSAALEIGEGTSTEVTVDGQTVTVELPKGAVAGEGSVKSVKALHFKEGGTVDIRGLEELDSRHPFSFGGWFLVPKANGLVLASKYDAAGKDKAHGWKLESGDKGQLTFMLIGDGEGDRVTFRPRGAAVSQGKWNHVFVAYDGSNDANGIVIYVNGKPFAAGAEDKATLKGKIQNETPLRLGGDGVAGFKGGALHDFRLYRRNLTADEVTVVMKWRDLKPALAKPDALSAAQQKDLAQLHSARFDEPYRKLGEQLLAAEREQRDIRRRSSVTHVQEERTDMQPMAHVLFRGQYDQKRDEVKPAVFSAFGELAADQPLNRLGLARWLTAAENPLAARVTVNRFWQEIFGTGLVRTSEDFGIMGEYPSHPELLDWLAVEFRESGWDTKKFFKLMVTSATYRQQAKVTPEKLQKDPGNRLLSRGPRFRMDAEMLRDYALAASGTLVRKIGGPSVKPYQPPGVWEAVAMLNSDTRVYQQEQGDSLYRRSMYTFWKRSAPPASMELFNAPSRENCTVRRERTNTPLQALVTMNDPQFVEAARRLAEATLTGQESASERLEFVARRILARSLTEKERGITLAALTDFSSHYLSQPEEAAKLILTGDSKPNPKLAPIELAAWTMLCSQVLNLDEALNK